MFAPYPCLSPSLAMAILQRICRCSTSLTSSRSTLSAKSRMPSTLMNERSMSGASSCLGFSLRSSTSPFFISHTMWSCAPLMRTAASSSPWRTRTIRSSTSADSRRRTWISVRSRYALICGRDDSAMDAMTCKPREASPAAMPAAAAASIPFIPPVCGTVTLLTFLMILPLASISTCLGSAPSSSRARAAA